jgi:peptidase M28-like protein
VRFSAAKVVVGVIVTAALAAPQDPLEPPAELAGPKLPEAVSGRILAFAGQVLRSDVSEESLRETIEELAGCGTRHSLSSWNDPKRGIGCGRDHIVARLNAISIAGGAPLRVVVDRFQATAERTHNQPVPLENVYGILPGSDPALSKTAIVVSGHFDSMPSDFMNPELDAPGADDDASGTAVSLECARLLAAGHYRATLVFAAVSGEEQGLLGGTRLLDYLRQNGYTVGAMLDNDIVGSDFAPGGPHRVRLFSGGGPDGEDSPSRELARAVEEIAGREHVRLIFRSDRLGRGGDHLPFVNAGLPAVRFTEPLEDYHHEHQTPRVENGVEFGDLIKFLNFHFIGDVAWANAEAMRELALAPAPPVNVTLSGAVTPDAKVSFSADNDPQRAGFEILWRDTTDPRWSVLTTVSQPIRQSMGLARERAGQPADEVILDGVSTDNHFFAVRSVGTNGARSIAVAALPRLHRQ